MRDSDVQRREPKAAKLGDLRATFATLLLQKGLEPIKVMKLGGWKTLKTMMIYVRKAGVDVAGTLDDFVLHDPEKRNGSLIDLFSSENRAK
ncbi:MAG: site-specific integrase [Bdellovibrionaceae bacterium]|nr:site-specific integrase [Pseudobdellovibrionaceae bacterium]